MCVHACVCACVCLCVCMSVCVCWQLWSVPFQMYSVQFKHVNHIGRFSDNHLKVSNVSNLVFK